MIEFTMRMVVNRWSEISDYFAWLIGHRDALADPDVHDSLLFDDDSFTRSRRYFWAINYLAELDDSIGGNIAQLETWIAEWPDHLIVQKKEMQAEVRSLPERLDQLKVLQEKLRALRLEAFALRDGVSGAPMIIRRVMMTFIKIALVLDCLEINILISIAVVQRQRCYRKQSSYTTWRKCQVAHIY